MTLPLILAIVYLQVMSRYDETFLESDPDRFLSRFPERIPRSFSHDSGMQWGKTRTRETYQEPTECTCERVAESIFRELAWSTQRKLPKYRALSWSSQTPSAQTQQPKLLVSTSDAKEKPKTKKRQNYGASKPKEMWSDFNAKLARSTRVPSQEGTFSEQPTETALGPSMRKPSVESQKAPDGSPKAYSSVSSISRPSVAKKGKGPKPASRGTSKLLTKSRSRLGVMNSPSASSKAEEQIAATAVPKSKSVPAVETWRATSSSHVAPRPSSMAASRRGSTALAGDGALEVPKLYAATVKPGELAKPISTVKSAAASRITSKLESTLETAGDAKRSSKAPDDGSGLHSKPSSTAAFRMPSKITSPQSRINSATSLRPTQSDRRSYNEDFIIKTAVTNKIPQREEEYTATAARSIPIVWHYSTPKISVLVGPNEPVRDEGSTKVKGFSGEYDDFLINGEIKKEPLALKAETSLLPSRISTPPASASPITGQHSPGIPSPFATSLPNPPPEEGPPHEVSNLLLEPLYLGSGTAETPIDREEQVQEDAAAVLSSSKSSAISSEQLHRKDKDEAPDGYHEELHDFLGHRGSLAETIDEDAAPPVHTTSSEVAEVPANGELVGVDIAELTPKIKTPERNITESSFLSAERLPQGDVDGDVQAGPEVPSEYPFPGVPDGDERERLKSPPHLSEAEEAMKDGLDTTVTLFPESHLVLVSGVLCVIWILVVLLLASPQHGQVDDTTKATYPTRTLSSETEVPAASTPSSAIYLCSTEYCLREGLYLSSLPYKNNSPCENFYKYICQKWGGASKLPHYGVGVALSRDTILESEMEYSVLSYVMANDDVLSARELYEQCQKSSSLWDVMALSEMFRNLPIQEWPYNESKSDQLSRKNVWTMAATLVKEFGIAAILSVTVGNDEKSNETVFQLDLPHFLLFEGDEGIQDIRNLFDFAIRETAKLVGHIDLAQLATDDVMSVLVAFAKRYPTFLNLDVKVVKLDDLPAGLQDFLTLVSQGILTKTPRVRLMSPDFILEDLESIFKEVSIRALLNYLGFRLIVGLAPFLPRSHEDLQKLFSIEALGRVSSPVAHWVLCLRAVEKVLPMCLVKAHAKLRIASGTIPTSRVWLSQLENIFFRNTHRLSWVDAATESLVHHNLKKSRLARFFPSLTVRGQSCATPIVKQGSPLKTYHEISKGHHRDRLRQGGATPQDPGRAFDTHPRQVCADIIREFARSLFNNLQNSFF